METYLSLDIEVTGPVSAYHTMIDIALVHYSIVDGKDQFVEFRAPLKEFTFNGGRWRWEPDTYQWWHVASRIKILEEIKRNAKDPVEEMKRLKNWIEQFDNPVLMAFGEDLEFVKLYWWEVFKETPSFVLHGLNAKAFAMAVCDLPLSDVKNTALRKWVPMLFDPKYPHTHSALDDAREQAVMFHRLRDLNKMLHNRPLPKLDRLDEVEKAQRGFIR